jgi:alanine racemase
MNALANAAPSTRALISLSALRHNLDAVRSYVGPNVKILAVVKADAYGHGARRLAAEAIRWGVHALGVARVHEGMDLRMGGITQPILVFELVPAEHLEKAVQQDLELTVATVEGARLLNSVAHRLGKKASVHVEIDTGMGRIGCTPAGAPGLAEEIRSLDAIELVGLYSHFATSEDRDRAFASRQLKDFMSVVDELCRRGIEIPLKHMANSGAIINIPDSHVDMVRPGIMLYGYPPARGMEERFPVKPVMSLVSTIAFLKTVEGRTPISYGRRYSTSRETVIATVPIGYADGLARTLTGKVELILRGKRYPVVGTICMDAIMADLGPEANAAVGDTVTIIGRDGKESVTAWDIAALVGTIPYEVTCLVAPRVPRIFVP